MTYSPGTPGTPGYQPAPPPGAYAAANPSFAKPADSASKLPLYLQIAVAVLGLATYLASFGPMLTVSDSELGGFTGDVGLAVPLAVFAALLAAVGLLPKAKSYAAIVCVVAVLGALLAIARTITKDDIFSVGWGLWLVLAFNVVQAIIAVGVLLLDSGVVTAPVPRPKYDPYAQYGLPLGTGYYGHGPQQPGYPSYAGYPPGPPTGGFGSVSAPPTGGFGTGPQHTPQPGPPTPPTGFPSFSPPPAGGSAAGGQSQGSVNSAQGEQPQGGQGQQSEGGQGQQTSSSAPPGPTPS
jgi:hypothetical protein